MQYVNILRFSHTLTHTLFLSLSLSLDVQYVFRQIFFADFSVNDHDGKRIFLRIEGISLVLTFVFLCKIDIIPLQNRSNMSSSEEEEDKKKKIPFSELVGEWSEKIGTNERMNMHSTVSPSFLFNTFISLGFHCENRVRCR